MSTKSLVGLYPHFVARTDSLVERYNACLPLPSDPRCRALCEAVSADGRAMLIIRLQMLWGEYCRNLVVQSAVGGCHTLDGILLSRGAGVTGPQAIQQAIYPQRRGILPGWHVPRFAVGVAKRLGIDNYDQILQALSLVSPVDDLRVVRNYIVHPWEKTKSAYVKVAWKFRAPGVDPVSLLAAKLPGGVTRFEAWVEEFQIMALEAIR